MKKIVGASVTILLIAGAGLWWLSRPSPPSAPVVETPETIEVDLSRIPPSGTIEYKNSQYSFSLFYPSVLAVEEIQDSGGARTIVFQNLEAALGFQVFIIPYAESYITDERFKRDVPSGIRTNVSAVAVGGMAGVAFDSEDLVLGETREVWFIKDGILYEVTAPRILGDWLDQILQTWEFE